MQPSDHVALTAWLDTLSYNGIRALESSQPALLPDGRRLRGIAITDRLFIGRDRKCYLLTNRTEHVVDVATPEQVLRVVTLDQMQMKFRELCRERARAKRQT